MRLTEDFLCRSCKALIEKGKQAEAAETTRGAQLGDAGFIALQVPNPEYKDATGYRILPVQMDWKTPEALEVTRAVCRMLLALLPECETMPTVKDERFPRMQSRDMAQAPALPLFNNSDRWPILYRLGTEEQRKAILAFWDTLAPLTAAAHQHGIDYGRNLLMQMAAGDITLNQLNETNTRGR